MRYQKDHGCPLDLFMREPGGVLSGLDSAHTHTIGGNHHGSTSRPFRDHGWKG
jgi:hypothetical protein